MSHDQGGDPPCWAHLFADGGGCTAGPDGVVLVDLAATDTTGPSGVVWSLPHGGDLDANVVHLGAGDAIGAHVNDEVDVLISVVAGRGVLTVADTTVQLRPGVLALIPRGHRRGVAAAGDGITYLSIHRRRPGLTIGTRPGPR